MKIEHVYIAGNRHDLRFTQCCVASIRRWYPEMPISLVKDEANGAYSTRELEEAWDVSIFQATIRCTDKGWTKLDPLFQESRKRCLVLDSDIVFLGRVIETLEASTRISWSRAEVRDRRTWSTITTIPLP